MTSFNPNWDSSWAATSIAASSITNGNTATTSSALDHDNKSGTEVSVSVTYGASATEGVKVYILRDTDGTNFEAVADFPWGYMLAYSNSGTHRRTITVLANSVSKFKVHLTNDSNSTVTATVKTRQFTIDQT